MFEDFFALHTTPFTREIDAASLFLTSTHREGLARLRYTVERRQIMLLTGETGAGKSTLLGAFNAQLDPTRYEAIYLCQTGATVGSILHEILRQLRVDPPYGITRAKALVARTISSRQQSQKRIVVLLVDEAENLSEAVLETLRGLATTEFDAFSPLALILSGQRHLATRLAMANLQPLAGRINLRYHLRAFSEEESADYTQHHLQRAGAENEIFTQPALERIHKASGGVPRRINQLATLSLMSAASSETKLVDDQLIDEVIHCEGLEAEAS